MISYCNIKTLGPTSVQICINVLLSLLFFDDEWWLRIFIIMARPNIIQHIETT